uniref:C2h2-type zn-finger protein n=1 Tax=Culex tarsalis TaxID=7177 RepID=A0A1Q3FW78_CULTA
MDKPPPPPQAPPPPFEMDKICRLCLQHLQPGSQVSLFAVNFSIRPADMITRCASVEIYEKDGLPEAICNDCFYKAGMAYEFRNRCECSDQKLRGYVAGTGSAVEEEKVEDEIYAAMDAIFGPKEEIEPVVGRGNVKKVQPIKKRAQLDELLVKHKAKLKEEGTKVNIFKQKRALRKNVGMAKRGKLLKAPEQCLICGKSFNYSGYLQAHQRIHSGEKPFECQICHRRFAQSGNLQLHLRIHNDERKYQCEICSKLFRTSSNLHAHRKTHSEERNNPCNLCERAFRTAQELRNHAETHKPVKSYVCRLCDNKAFHKQSYLNSHIKTVHIGVKRHRCQDCGKIFSNSSNLIAHRRTHNGDRPYACQECEAKFTQSPALLRHIKAKHRPKPPAEPAVIPEVEPEPFEPNIEVDENRSLDSAASSELSVATSLIDNHTGYTVPPYLTNYVPPQPHQMQLSQMAPPSTTGTLYPGDHMYQHSVYPTHSYQQQHQQQQQQHQQHLDVGSSYDMCYTMPVAHHPHSAVINPSLMNPQPTYIFDQ